MPDYLKCINKVISPFGVELRKREKYLCEPFLPWYTSASIAWLEEHIDTGMTVLEYGGGSSSLWWCERVGEVYTFEASTSWVSRIAEQFANRPELLRKWRLIMSPCDWPNSVEKPKRYWRIHRNCLEEADVQNMEQGYLMTVEKDLDVIVVDGAIRKQTLLKTREIIDRSDVKFVVVDNTNNDLNSRLADEILPPSFERIDFNATEKDDVSWSHDSRWITSIWVSQQFAQSQAASS